MHVSGTGNRLGRLADGLGRLASSLDANIAVSDPSDPAARATVGRFVVHHPDGTCEDRARR
ncbi:hypothetical protein QCN29_35650 [Streptomyces sp. HNM0663]|uniref:Uncharacterized protein n=1 Tax=Streptomyces chengmaiensis TaxID=3040919 RepID=A0ABT6HZE3_9ACTN|nr:hypothetical protein [Streptomyces chengmaiensis]